MSTEPDDVTSLSISNLPYGSLLELVGVKDKTLRTWLRKFPEVGERQPNGKLLFSPLECISLHTFTVLVTRLYMQPAVAAKIANEGLLYMKGQFIKDIRKRERETLYLVVSDATLDNPDYAILDEKSINQRLVNSGIGLSPFMVIPIDLSMTALHASVFRMRDSTEKLFNDLLKASSEGEEIEPERLKKVKESIDTGNKIISHLKALRENPTNDQSIVDEGIAIIEKQVKKRKDKKT